LAEALTCSLLPLDGAGGLTGDVQRHPVDAGDLVDDAVADALEEVVGRRAQSAVIASSEVTARMTTG
jgi:hypothetical protein